MSDVPKTRPQRPKSLSVNGLADATGCCLAAATLIGLAGQLNWFFDIFSHFRPQYFIGAILLAGFYGLRRAGTRFGLAAGAALANLVVLQPHLIEQLPSERRVPKRLSLLWWNVHAPNTRHDEAIAWLSRSNADIIALGEITPAWERALQGLNEQFRYRHFQTRSDHFGIALLSRLPLFESRTISPPGSELPSLQAQIHIHGRSIKLFATHPLPPIGNIQAKRRNEQLRWLAEIIRANQPSVVVLGDLNTTPWNHAYRSFLERAKLNDGPQRVRSTWPRTVFPLRIPIDHGLVDDDLQILKKTVGPFLGSDHAPIQLEIGW